MVSDSSDKTTGSTTRDESANIVEFDWRQEESASIAVVESVATLTGRDPTKLKPLAEVVDTDALNEIFSPARETARSRGYVEFEYEQCTVRVHADGTVRSSSK